MNRLCPSLSAAVSLQSNLAATLFLIALFAIPARAQQEEWPKEQTPDLMALRCSTSPAERKLSFNLLLISRQARHAPLGSFASSLDTSPINADGTVNVEVIAYLSPSLMGTFVMASIIRTNGAIPLPAYASDHLRVRVTETQLLDLAANANVLSIRDGSANHASSKAATTPRPTLPPAL